MSQMFTRFSVEIDAPPKAVWAMLTDPNLTRQYMFGCEVVTDWKVGSRCDWRGTYDGKTMTFVVGKVVSYRPNELLEYTTFDPNGGLEDTPANHVTMSARIVERAGGCRLELSQGDFSTVQNGAARFADAQKGGHETLDKMKSVAESLKV